MVFDDIWPYSLCRSYGEFRQLARQTRHWHNRHSRHTCTCVICNLIHVLWYKRLGKVFNFTGSNAIFFFFFFFFFFLSRVRIFVFWLFPCIKCCVKPRKTLNGSQETLLGSFLWLDVSSNKQRKLAFLNFSPASRHRRDPAFRPFFSRVPTHLPPPTPQQFSDCFKLAEDINHYQLANVVVISGSVQKYILIPRFWRETNFFVFVCILIICSSELPHTTTTKVTPASKYPMKTKVE